MKVTRRDLLQKLATGGTALLVGAGASSTPLLAAVEPEMPKAPRNAVALLYDATRCVGCQTCVYACAQANNLQPDPSALHLAATDLNTFTKNIIKMYRAAGGNEYSFVKQQCMHCLEPACVSGCPFHALHKDASLGFVAWEPAKCVGCRYCEIACPFHIPRFQWEGFNPKIVKCEFCKERLAAGKQPACSAVCPVQAVVFGKREALLAEARRRIRENPGRYYQNRVYGEFEGGGTQALYLSHVAFEKLGLPNLDRESIPHKYLKWQTRLYSYLVFPAALYASIATVIRSKWKDHMEHLYEEEKKTGLRAQL